LFTPIDAVLADFSGGGGEGRNGPSAPNPPSGARIHYYLKTAGTPVTLEFLAPDGTVIKRYESSAPAPAAGAGGGRGGSGAAARVTTTAGHNTFTWDMRYPDASSFRGMILWAGNVRGPLSPPGTYTVRMTAGGVTQSQTFKLVPDPRSEATLADLVEQFNFLVKIRDRVTEANDAVKTSRWVKYELDDRQGKITGAAARQLATRAKTLADAISAAEAEIYQVRNQSNQDPLNYPIKLNNKIAALNGNVASAPFKPTKQAYDVFTELSGKLQIELERMNKAIAEQLPAINDILRRAGLAPIEVKAEDPPARPANRATMDDILSDDHQDAA
jgi:hypothetical protein